MSSDLIPAALEGGRLLALQLTQPRHDAPGAPFYRVDLVLSVGERVVALHAEDATAVDWSGGCLTAPELTHVRRCTAAPGQVVLVFASGRQLVIHTPRTAMEVL